MSIEQLQRELNNLKNQRLNNLYFKDSYTRVITQYIDYALGKEIEKKIERIEYLIREIEDFSGDDPAAWRGNIISMSICPECILSEICEIWNEFSNRHASPHHHAQLDKYGDEIEYDNTGNMKYQIVNLKTGEKV